MHLLVRQFQLLALSAAIAAICIAPRPSRMLLPGKRRLWEVWPALRHSMFPCWRCSRARWGEDLSVFRLLRGGCVAICDDCLKKGASCGVS